jgi:hypothetical protein
MAHLVVWSASDYSNRSDPFLAYCAGLIDGEGSIYIKKETYQSKTNPKYRIVFKITMTEEPLIDLLSKTFNGTYHLTTGNHLSRKSLYSMHLGDRKAIKAITSLLPYLMLKKKQAELALEFVRTREEFQAKGNRLSIEQREVYERFYQESRRLNS